MAKYHNQNNNPFVVSYVQAIVREALDFQQSELCIRNLKEAGAHPRDWKYVAVRSHRRAGHSEAAKELFLDYGPSLIITGRHESARLMRHNVISTQLHRNIVRDPDYLADNIIPASTVDDHWFPRLKDPYRLIILDNCAINAFWDSSLDLDEARFRLYNHCELLVELG